GQVVCSEHLSGARTVAAFRLSVCVRSYCVFIFFFKQKTAYEIGLGIPAEPLFRSALDEEKWLNMLGTFVKDWFRYESHFVHGRDSLVDILKERGLLSESDAVQPLIGKKS